MALPGGYLTSPRPVPLPVPWVRQLGSYTHWFQHMLQYGLEIHGYTGGWELFSLHCLSLSHSLSTTSCVVLTASTTSRIVLNTSLAGQTLTRLPPNLLDQKASRIKTEEAVGVLFNQIHSWFTTKLVWVLRDWANKSSVRYLQSG